MHKFTELVTIELNPSLLTPKAFTLNFPSTEYLAATCMFSYFLVLSCAIVKDQFCADPEAADFLHISLALEVGLGAAIKDNGCETFLTYTSLSRQKKVGDQDMSSQHQGKGKKKQNLC